MHPNAKWLITYSDNASQWVDSVQAHVQAQAPTKHERVLGCHMYGCEKGLADGVRKTFVFNATALAAGRGAWIPKGAERELLAAYRLYYERLFKYLESRSYAMVDVRADRYVNLSSIHPALRGPFRPRNTRKSRGQWPRCLK